MSVEIIRRGQVRPITDLPPTTNPDGSVELERAGHFYSVPSSYLSGGDPALNPIGTELPDYSSEFNEIPAAWTWLNQGASTVAAWQKRALLTPEVSGGPAANSVRLFGPPAVPGGNWAARTVVGFNSIVANCGGGLAAYRAASGDFTLQSALTRVAAVPFSCRLLTGYWSDFATFSTVVRDDNPPQLEQRVWFMQTRYDGTNLYFDYSADNAVFYNIAQVNAVTAIGGAPTRIMIAANAPAVADGSATSFRWLRVYGNSNLNQGP